MLQAFAITTVTPAIVCRWAKRSLERSLEIVSSQNCANCPFQRARLRQVLRLPVSAQDRAIRGRPCVCRCQRQGRNTSVGTRHDCIIHPPHHTSLRLTLRHQPPEPGAGVLAVRVKVEFWGGRKTLKVRLLRRRDSKQPLSTLVDRPSKELCLWWIDARVKTFEAAAVCVGCTRVVWLTSTTTLDEHGMRRLPMGWIPTMRRVVWLTNVVVEVFQRCGQRWNRKSRGGGVRVRAEGLRALGFTLAFTLPRSVPWFVC